jgi:hypothetical protein
MTKTWSATLLIVAALLIWPFVHRPVVIRAQTVPVTLHARWNPNPPTENVTNYQITLDTAAPQDVALTSCTATVCDATFVVPTFGAHSLALVAQNLLLSGDPTSVQSSPPTTVSFTLNPSPGRSAVPTIRRQ